MEFKVGDKVKIRYDLSEDEEYHGIGVDLGMLEYRGKIATIKVVHNDYYDIDIDNDDFGWTDEMFEGFGKEVIPCDILETRVEVKTKTEIKLEELEKRLEKLEKCVIGEQNSLEKSENVSSMSEFTKEDIESLKFWKDENYKWTCKDENGTIHIFKCKPILYNIEELLEGND